MVAFSAENRSLIQNGGFEQLDDNGNAVGWSSSSYRGKGSFSIESEVVHSGKYSAKIHSEVSEFRGWFATLPIPVQRKGVYELSGWIKTEGFTGGDGAPAPIFSGSAILGLYMLGKLKEWVGYKKLISVNTATDWKLFKKTYTIPLNVHYVGVRLWGEYMMGTAYFDDVSFIQTREGLPPDAELPDVSDQWLYNEWAKAMLKRSQGKLRKEIHSESYGWIHGPYLKGLILGYLYSKDEKWLELFVKRVDWLLSLLSRDKAGYVGWYGLPLDVYLDKKTRAHSDTLVGEGLILFPMSLFVEVVTKEPSPRQKYSSKAETYLKLIGELIRKWDKRGDWRVLEGDAGVWVYPQPLGPQRRGMTLAKNQMCPIAKTCLVMWRLTGDDYFREKARRVASFIKSTFIERKGYVEWDYWSPAGKWDYRLDGSARHWIGRDHRAGYSAIVADFIGYAFHHAVVFTADDVKKVINRQLHQLDPQTDGPHWFWSASLAEFDARIMKEWYERIKANPGLPSSWGGQVSVPLYLLKKRLPTGYTPLYARANNCAP